jgi:hypothetical protein
VGLADAKLVQRERLVPAFLELPGQVERLARVLPGLLPTTPPYPTYAGNMAAFGAACATVLARFFETNDIAFEVHWEGTPGWTRAYPSFWAIADEEARSRIYGGIHFHFDNTAGQEIGIKVGNYLIDNFMLPRSR